MYSIKVAVKFAVSLAVLAVFLCLLAESQCWWSRRIPRRGSGGYRRYGRSDPALDQGGDSQQSEPRGNLKESVLLVENIDEDYDDNELIEALADVLIERQDEKVQHNPTKILQLQ